MTKTGTHEFPIRIRPNLRHGAHKKPTRRRENPTKFVRALLLFSPPAKTKDPDIMKKYPDIIPEYLDIIPLDVART
ncbi:hypothetical protein [Opitutus sp. ER46]|uniref:hypothetical protein n=1 Tax=Opitutus sp. ER46 TaxID=2161864 RepID=UPI0011B27738|nr:hypothetical protein [Opitutus sp. ER46]